MRHVPARSAGIADVVAQQALPRRGDIALGLLPGSDDIARGFLRWRGDMHCVRRPGAQIQRQTPCIPSVGLDPIAGTLGNHRRYDDYAVHPFAAQITMQPESAPSSRNRILVHIQTNENGVIALHADLRMRETDLERKPVTFMRLWQGANPR